MLQGDFDEAVGELERLTEDGATVVELAELAGRVDEGSSLLVGLEDPSLNSAVPLALAWYRLGNPDEALRWLTAAYEQRSGRLVSLNAPWFTEMRRDAAFQEVFDGLNFPPP